MRDTFEEDELSESICSILLTAMYIRPRWRAAPTVLNGTHLFYDADDAPARFMRMIRINDIMRYTELNEWDAQVSKTLIVQSENLLKKTFHKIKQKW